MKNAVADSSLLWPYAAVIYRLDRRIGTTVYWFFFLRRASHTIGRTVLQVVPILCSARFWWKHSTIITKTLASDLKNGPEKVITWGYFSTQTAEPAGRRWGGPKESRCFPWGIDAGIWESVGFSNAGFVVSIAFRNWRKVFINVFFSSYSRVGPLDRFLARNEQTGQRRIHIHQLEKYFAGNFFGGKKRRWRIRKFVVFQGFAPAFAKHDSRSVNLLGEDFDFTSIMMYDEYAFSKVRNENGDLFFSKLLTFRFFFFFFVRTARHRR